MNDKLIKYANVILTKCLKIKKGQPLLISGSYESYQFVRILADEAIKLGVRDIEFDMTDAYIKKSMYENYSIDELKEHKFFNRDIFDEYSKKDAAFLMLAYEYPNLMKDIDKDVIAEMRKFMSLSTVYFNECRHQNKLAWCIACVPNNEWANTVYPNDTNAIDKLWDDIFDITFINDKNTIKEIDKSLDTTRNICDKLNSMKIKELHLKNSKGTDVTIGLFEKTRWCSGLTKLADGRDILVNYPSFEVFTAPNKMKVNGIVYSTMPLLTNGVVIDEFSMRFENGRIVEVKALEHEKLLQKIITNQENADYLGEIALVPHDSKIRNKETLFYTTLIDENASCHMAFGSAYSECYEGADKMSDEQLNEIGLNVSKTHIDFMFGTEDLEINAITYDNKKIPLFKNGNYTKEIL